MKVKLSYESHFMGYHEIFQSYEHHNVRVKWKLTLKNLPVMWFKASNCSTEFTHAPISVGGVVLQVTEKQKYLGLIFDSTMSWIHHIANVCCKMSYYLRLLRSHQHVIDNSLMKMLLESLVLSHLSYCVIVWDHHWEALYCKDFRGCRTVQ